MIKGWWLSKTVWAMVLGIAVSIGAAFGVTPAELPGWVSPFILFIVGFFLRFVTKQPIR